MGRRRRDLRRLLRLRNRKRVARLQAALSLLVDRRRLLLLLLVGILRLRVGCRLSIN